MSFWDHAAAVVERIREDYAQPLRIAALAAKAGLSISRMEPLMQSVLHVSPRQLLNRQRVEAAAALLANPAPASPPSPWIAASVTNLRSAVSLNP